MIKTFSQAQKFIFSHIDANWRRFSGGYYLNRAKTFFGLLDNPQNKLKIIHVAGTSGKGSTTFYISQILESQSLKVSSMVSPHLLDIRERCQVNNHLVTEDEFVSALNEIMSAIMAMEKTEYKKPSYFEIMTAMFFWISLKNRVDYAVAETGLGGMFDATNTVTRRDKLCVITRIGMDHMEFLGNTLSEIAIQKSGIIGPGNRVIVAQQEKEVQNVIEARTREAGGSVTFANRDFRISNASVKNGRAVFDFTNNSTDLKNLTLNTRAIYQADNCGLALETVFYLSGRDGFKTDEKIIRERLDKVHFLGRMDIYNVYGKTVVLDGAHNPQKMKALTESLCGNGMDKAVFLIAFKEGKDYKNMLPLIIPLASRIIITSFETTDKDWTHHSVHPVEIKTFLESMGFTRSEVILDQADALKKAMAANGKYLVITGSLYLLSALYPSVAGIAK